MHSALCTLLAARSERRASLLPAVVAVMAASPVSRRPCVHVRMSMRSDREGGAHPHPVATECDVRATVG